MKERKRERLIMIKDCGFHITGLYAMLNGKSDSKIKSKATFVLMKKNFDI